MNDRRITIEIPPNLYEKNDFDSIMEFIDYLKSFKPGLNPKNLITRLKLKDAK